MDKNLATIQEITDVQNVPNADSLDVVSVLGWKCVTKRNEFKVGDKCVYIAIDTIVPETPQFEFLRKVHFRIKTCRLRKCLSQGIVFPLGILSNGEYVIGQDVSEMVGVKKYEKPVPINMAGQVKGSFVGHTPKTDEILLQSIPKVLDEIRGKDVYISVKCDGTSATFSNLDGEMDVCSRNLSLKDTEGNIYWNMFKKYNLENKLKEAGNVSIQAELCGPGIQKNRLGLKEHELFVFQVYDIKAAKYLNFKDFMAFCTTYNLQTVPIEKVCSFDFTMEQLLEMAKGKYSSGKEREGIVIRPLIEAHSPIIEAYGGVAGGRMSFKVLNNNFLEKEED